jgi:hypothetical protein
MHGFLAHDGNHAPKWPFVLNKDSPQARGLVGWWPMMPTNGVELRDLAGRVGTQSLNGSPAWQSNVLGGQFLSFNGASEWLSFADPSALFDSEATISFWIRLANATPSGGSQTGICYMEAAAISSSHYPFTDGNAYISTFRTARENAITLSASIDRTRWHLFTVTTKPGAGNWRLYQNAEEVRSANPSFSIQAGWLIGRSSTGDLVFGEIGPIMLYNVYRGPSEIWHSWAPSTRWDLYYELDRRRWYFTAAGFVPFPSSRYAMTGGMQ